MDEEEQAVAPTDDPIDAELRKRLSGASDPIDAELRSRLGWKRQGITESQGEAKGGIATVTSGAPSIVSGRGGRALIPAEELGRLAGSGGLRTRIQANLELARQSPQDASEGAVGVDGSPTTIGGADAVRKAVRAARDVSKDGVGGTAAQLFVSNLNSPFLPKSVDAANDTMLDRAARDGNDPAAHANLYALSAMAGDLAGNLGLGAAFGAGNAMAETADPVKKGALALAARIAKHSARGAGEMGALGAAGASAEGDEASGGKPSLGAGGRFLASKEGVRQMLTGAALGGGMAGLHEANTYVEIKKRVDAYRAHQAATDDARRAAADAAEPQPVTQPVTPAVEPTAPVGDTGARQVPMGKTVAVGEMQGPKLPPPKRTIDPAETPRLLSDARQMLSDIGFQVFDPKGLNIDPATAFAEFARAQEVRERDLYRGVLGDATAARYRRAMQTLRNAGLDATDPKSQLAQKFVTQLLHSLPVHDRILLTGHPDIPYTSAGEAWAKARELGGTPRNAPYDPMAKPVPVEAQAEPSIPAAPIAPEPPAATAAPAPSTTEPIAVVPTPAPPAPVERPALEGHNGASTQVILADGQKLAARYKVVDAQELQTSHHHGSFLPNADYPAGVQGRDYEKNTSAQDAVRDRAFAYDPDRALNPSHSAGEGPATITPDGTVLAGNDRTMAFKLATEVAPQRIHDYFAALRENAERYGLDVNEIDRMAAEGKIPVLVRELTDAADTARNPERWSEINRLSDDITGKAKSASESGAAKAARLVTSGAMEHLRSTIEPGQSVALYLRTNYGKEFLRLVKEQKVFTPEEMGAFEEKGVLNDAGSDAVRRMIQATAVENSALLADADPKIAAKIEAMAPPLTVVHGTRFGTITRGLTNALEVLRRAREMGTSVEELAAQGGFLGPDYPPALIELAVKLRDATAAEMRAMAERYAILGRDTLRNEAGGGTDMFGGEGLRSPGAAFSEAFGTKDSYGDLNGAGAAQESGGGGRGRRSAASAPSLFGGENLFGEPLSVGESEVGRRAPKAPVATGEAPELRGAIGAEEMSARRNELGFEPSEAEKTAGADQQSLAFESVDPLGSVVDTPRARNTEGVVGDGASVRKPRYTPAPGSVGARVSEAKAKLGKAVEAVRRADDSVQIDAGGRKIKVLAPDLEGIRWREIAQSIKEFLPNLYAPETLGPDAKRMATIAGRYQADNLERRAQLEYLTQEMSHRVGRLSRAKKIELWNALEGENWNRPWAHDLAASVDERLPDVIDAMQAARKKIATELEQRGILVQHYENFLGRFWNMKGREREMGAIFGKRPLAGAESFKKERIYDTFVDGLRAGLKPLTYNVIDAQLLKYEELGKSLAVAKMMEEAEAGGLARKVIFGHAVPKDVNGDEWVVPNRSDPKFTLYGPRSIEVIHRESYDRNLMAAIKQVISTLGVKYVRDVDIRQPGIGHNVLGFAERSGNKMAARFGTSLGTTFHELGHILDFKFDLASKLMMESQQLDFEGKPVGIDPSERNMPKSAARAERVEANDELRALADLRDESLIQGGVDNRSKSRKAYVRNTEEKMANVLDFYFANRERMRDIAPQTTARLESFLRSRPELQPLVDVQAGVEREVNAQSERVDLFGNPIIGNIYMPRHAAQVMRNLTSQSFASHPMAQAVTAPGRMITQMKLGFSLFHATTIAQEAIYSEISREMERGINGIPGIKSSSFLRRALSPVTTAGESVTRMFKPETAWTEGAKLRREAIDPGAYPEYRPIIELMKEGGYTVNASSDLWTGDHMKAMRGAVDDAIAANADLKEGATWRGSLEAGRAAGKAFVNALPSVTESIAAPLMKHYVPSLKDIATAQAVRQMVDGLPAGTDVYTRAEKIRDIVREMDYRFGQVNYNNHFMNATAKWVAQTVLMAPGWTVGTLALAGKVPGELAGSGRSIAKRLRGEQLSVHDAPMVGSATAYWAANVAVTGLLNGLATYAFTGQVPKGKDFVMFRDGTQDADGNDNRWLLPGYLTHDIWNYAHHPLKTLANKINPAASMLRQWAENRDYFGNEVYDPEGNVLSQLGSSLGENLKPLSYTNYQESKRRGEAGSVGRVMANTLGITPAHKEDVVTPAQNYLREVESKQGHPMLTPEKVAEGDARRSARAKAANGDDSELRALIRRGILTPEQAQKIWEEAQLGPDERIAKRVQRATDAKQAQTFYEKGNDRERRLTAEIVRKKVEAAARKKAAAGVTP